MSVLRFSSSSVSSSELPVVHYDEAAAAVEDDAAASAAAAAAAAAGTGDVEQGRLQAHINQRWVVGAALGPATPPLLAGGTPGLENI